MRFFQKSGDLPTMGGFLRAALIPDTCGLGGWCWFGVFPFFLVCVLCIYFPSTKTQKMKQVILAESPFFSPPFLLKFLIRSSGFLAAGRALVGFSGILAVPALCLMGKVWLMKEIVHFYRQGNRLYIVLAVALQLANYDMP